MDALAKYDLARLLRARPRGEVRVSGRRRTRRARAARAARAARPPRPPLLRPRRPGDRRRRLRRAARRAARASRPSTPSSLTPGLARPSASAASRSRALHEGHATCSRCSRWPTRAARRSCAPGSRACATTSRARASRTREFEYVAEPKIDGLAISLRLPRRRARARRHARQRRGRRGRHPQPAHDRRDPAAHRATRPPLLEVRGEVYMSLPDFAALNERRAEAGPVDVHEPAQLGRGHDPPARPQARRRAPAVDVVPTAIGVDRGHRASTATGRRSSGCASTASASTTTSSGSTTEDEVVAQCLAWQERRGALDFEIDGVVVKVDDVELQRRLGVVGRDPRWAIAWKFPPTTAVTRLQRACMWNVGKFGDLHPFAVLEPVHVGGVTVKLATLHNEEDLARKDIRAGRRGDRPARRRRDPAGALARAARRSSTRTARRRRGRPSAARSATRRRSRPRARSSPSARTATARSAAGSCSSTSSRAGRWTSTGWARSRSRSSRSAGLVKTPGDFYRLDASSSSSSSRAAARCQRRAHAGERSRPPRTAPFGRVLFAIGIEEVGYVTGRNLAQQFRTDRRAARRHARADRGDAGRRARRWPR